MPFHLQWNYQGKSSACSLSPFLKKPGASPSPQLDICTYKNLQGRRSRIIFHCQNQGSKNLWAMRNHPSRCTHSCSHLYLLSHAAALMFALPNEVPQGICSSCSSRSLTHASLALPHSSALQLLVSYAPFLSRKSLPGSASCHLADRCSAQAPLYHFYIVAAWLNISRLASNFLCSQSQGIALPTPTWVMHDPGVLIPELFLVFLTGGAQRCAWEDAFLWNKAELQGKLPAEELCWI